MNLNVASLNQTGKDDHLVVMGNQQYLSMSKGGKYLLRGIRDDTLGKGRKRTWETLLDPDENQESYWTIRKPKCSIS